MTRRARQLRASPLPTSTAASHDWTRVTGAVLIILLTWATYLPALDAGYIWDDEHHVGLVVPYMSLKGLRWLWT